MGWGAHSEEDESGFGGGLTDDVENVGEALDHNFGFGGNALFFYEVGEFFAYLIALGFGFYNSFDDEFGLFPVGVLFDLIGEGEYESDVVWISTPPDIDGFGDIFGDGFVGFAE